MNDSRNNHWLVRATTVRLLWLLFILVLMLTVSAQLVFKVKGYFGVDGWFGFGAVFGFLACLILVLLAKLLGAVLKRRQDYYDDGSADE